MSLIACPECGKTISSQAWKCVHCGYPLGMNSKAVKMTIYSIGAILWGLLILNWILHAN